jgi:ribosomal protein S18 acetylase RimI-like enzyme
MDSHPDALDTAPLPLIELTAAGVGELDEVRAIFREYAAGLGIDLCFQNFEEELAGLPGEYEAPRGALFVARVDGELAGCCALRGLDSADYPNAAEMKRLYVRKPFRGFGLGRQLAEAALDAARRAGYDSVLLDTLDDMEAARALYEDLGFEDIPPYYHNPIAGAHYLKADLWNTSPAPLSSRF